MRRARRLGGSANAKSSFYLRGLNGVAKRASGVCLGLMVCVALGGCMEKAEPLTGNKEASRSNAQPSNEAIGPELVRKFKAMAPSDWRLRRASEEAAKYDVHLEGGPDGEPIVVRGVVLLDGRFERYLSALDFSASAIASEREEFGTVPVEYPKVDGFEAVIDSYSLGFDSNRSIDRRSIKYFNRDQGVFCRGTSPGLLRCLWGNPEVRLVLNFHSDQTVPALQYIKKNVFEE